MFNSPQQKIGFYAALLSFLGWGFSPLYWSLLVHLPTTDILTHRIIWSFAFAFGILLFQSRTKEITNILKNPKQCLLATTAALLIGLNWFVFIWAVQNNRVLEASIGYYITPLLKVALGVAFFNESLNKSKILSLIFIIAAMGLAVISYGHLPWVALSLALTFSFYALIRKSANFGALAGLAFECALLAVPALIYLAIQPQVHLNYYQHTDGLLLIGVGLITTVLSAAYTFGARRISLSAIGIMQYIGPTCVFVLGFIFFGEVLTWERITVFALIWSGIIVYLFGTVKISFLNKPAASKRA